MSDVLSRQRARHQARITRKHQHRKPVSERLKRLAFKTARMVFAEVAALQAKYQGLELQEKLRSLDPYRSRGKGRGTPSRNYGHSGNAPSHQGVQERLRRSLGGWAQVFRTQGVTKRMYLAGMPAHG